MQLSHVNREKIPINAIQTEKFCQFVNKNSLVSQNDKLLVALSGGADSVFLLYMLLCIKDKYSLDIEAFHLNHCIRTNAASDADFVKTLCADLDVNLYSYTTDIPKKAKDMAISQELAGRIERYSIITSLEDKFDKIATAHHADDNAETVIMHLIRGSGIDGLCGIPIRRDKIIRPLLCFEKSEILAFINEYEIPFVQDETNFENIYFRNRVRNEILPLLKKENVSFSKNMLSLSSIACDYSSLAVKEAEKLPVIKQRDKIIIMFDILFSAPSCVKYEFIKKTAAELGVNKDITNASITDILSLISDRNKTVWDYNIHSLVISRRYEKLSLIKSTSVSGTKRYTYRINKEGIFVFAKQAFALKLKITKEFEKNTRDKHIMYVDYDKINDILTVRNRRESDSFYLIGINGAKTLKRFFIDRKINKDMRDEIPILTDGENIVCICGHETDRRYMVTENTKKILQIQYLE